MLTNLYNYVQSIQPERDTPLAKAVNYFNNRWSEILTFLEDGHVELTNNISERAVKPLEKLLPWSKGMPEYTKQELNKYM